MKCAGSKMPFHKKLMKISNIEQLFTLGQQHRCLATKLILKRLLQEKKKIHNILVQNCAIVCFYW